MSLIVDLTGPSAVYSSRLLVEAGHEIIRVESRSGDAVRRLGPFLGDQPDLEHGAFHQFLNAGKRSLTVNPRQPDGQQVFLELVQRADALIGNRRLPVEETILLETNPRLVLILVEDDEPELCTYARSGLLSITGHPGRTPTVLGGHVVYAATGLYVAVATAAAMLEQQLSGCGQVVTVSVRECMESLAEQAMVTYTLTGEVTERRGYRAGVTAVCGALPCKDGYWMLSVPATPEGWSRFIDWAQHPVLMTDPSLADEAERNAKRDFILDQLEEWSRSYSKAEIVAEAQARHLPASPVATPLELADDPQLVARGFLTEVEHPEFDRLLFPAGAIATVKGTRVGLAPRLGQHNAEILAELGYSEADHQALIECGAI